MQMSPLLSPADYNAASALLHRLTATFDDTHGASHALAVFRNAEAIAASPAFDSLSADELSVIGYSALLHDCVDHKYPDTYEVNSRELNAFLQGAFEHTSHLKRIIFETFRETCRVMVKEQVPHLSITW